MTELETISLSEIVPTEHRWLWEGLIPRGGLTLLEGDPGCGKSSVMSDVAARVSTGSPMFGSTTSTLPESVILFQDEDTPDVTRRNLTTAGADLQKVFVINQALPSGPRPLMLPDDLDFVASEAANRKAAMLVIDPIAAFFSVSLNSDQAVRRVTKPLARLAERLGMAIVLVRHFTKSGGSNALYRGSGSIGLIGAARSGLLVAPDPSDPDRRVLAQFKSNWNTRAQSLVFRSVSHSDGFAIEWLGGSGFAAEQLLNVSGANSRPELEHATYAIYSILGDGPVPANQAKQLAAKAGIAERTLRRAKEILGVRSERRGFGCGSTFRWELPSQSDIVRRLVSRDLDELLDKLIHGGSSTSGELRRNQDAKDQKPDRRRRREFDDDGAGNAP